MFVKRFQSSWFVSCSFKHSNCILSFYKVKVERFGSRLNETIDEAARTLGGRVPSPSCSHRKNTIADRCAAYRWNQQSWCVSRAELSSWRTSGCLTDAFAQILWRRAVDTTVRQHTSGAGSTNGLLASVAPEVVVSYEWICSPRRPASPRHLGRTENGSVRLQVHQPTQRCSVQFTDNKCARQSHESWTCQRVAHRSCLA